ncbi:hypothetical protein D3C74_413700 [compost metagenome]
MNRKPRAISSRKRSTFSPPRRIPAELKPRNPNVMSGDVQLSADSSQRNRNISRNGRKNFAVLFQGIAVEPINPAIRAEASSNGVRLFMPSTTNEPSTIPSHFTRGSSPCQCIRRGAVWLCSLTGAAGLSFTG